MIKAILNHRGVDTWGSGAFGASRGDRTHNGIDYACLPGAFVYAPVTGDVTKIGYPYADDTSYRYVEITDVNRQKHRIFYINPTVTKGMTVIEGRTVIGEVQNIAARYGDPVGMINHVHYEIKDEHGNFINPEG